MDRATGKTESLGSQLRRTGRGHRIDDYNPDPEFLYLIEAFWVAKGYGGDLDEPLRREYLEGTLLDRNERAIILAMDRAFRPALASERAQNDKYLASKHR